MGNKILAKDSNLMTTIMMGDEQRIINYIERQGKLFDLNQKINKMGDTLAHYCAYKGYKQVLQYIIKNNGSLTETNTRRLTPRDIANAEIREYITQLLEEKQKQIGLEEQVGIE